MDTKRVKLLIKLAQDANDAAAADMAKQRLELEGAEQQLQQLVDFQKEYANKPGDLATASSLIQRRSFMAKLMAAVDAQKEIIEGIKQSLSQYELAWRQARQKLEAMKKLELRLNQREQKKVLSREQRETDEYATSAQIRRRL